MRIPSQEASENQKRTTRFRRVRPFLLPALILFLAYFLIALIYTWPLATNLTTYLPGASSDAHMHFWNGWSVREALSHGRSPLYATTIFYPNGVSLLTHNIAWLNVIPWLFLQTFINDILAYNLIQLGNLALCGSTMFLLAHLLTKNKQSAFLAGLIYLTWPFRLSQLDHPNLFATYLFPLFFYFLIRTLQNGRRSQAILTGLTLALIGYSRWQLLIGLAVMAALYLLWQLPRFRSTDRRPLLGRLILAAFIGGVLLLPPAAALFAAQQAESNQTDLFKSEDELIMQTDLLAYVTPASDHWLFGRYTNSTYDHYYPERPKTRRFTAYIGAITLLLSGLALLFRRRQSAVWLLIALVLIGFALGPIFRFNGTLHENIPTLYSLAAPFKVIGLMRVPDRFNIFLALPFAVLAAIGTAEFLKRLPGRLPAGGPTILLGLLILADTFGTPKPLKSMARPPILDQLAADLDPYAVLNIPIDPFSAKEYMFYQTAHQHPILQGKIARIPDKATAFTDNHPWLREIGLNGRSPRALADVGEQMASLAEAGIKYIIVHKSILAVEQVENWRRYMTAVPYYEDESLLIYLTELTVGENVMASELGTGLGVVDAVLARDCVGPGQLLLFDVAWGGRAAVGEGYELDFALVGPDGARHTLGSGAVRPFANSVTWQQFDFVVPWGLADGAYELVVSLSDGGGESYRLATALVSGVDCGTAVNVAFGDALRLLAFDTKSGEGELLVELDWQSMRAITEEYIIFVHVFDLETGENVAQSDVMPRNWQYPTRYWWTGEVVADEVVVSMDGVQLGRYGLAVGVYEFGGADRLVAVDGAGEVVENGRLMLTEVDWE